MENKERSGRHGTAVLAVRIAAIAAAGALFCYYVASNAAAYKWHMFIVPFIALAGFTAVFTACVPRLIGALSGKNDLPLIEGGKKAERMRSFALICVFALILHIVTTLVGIAAFRILNESARELNLLTVWEKAWMKSNTDARHYINIAENWYASSGDDEVLIVFLPFFPILIRAFNFVIKNSFYSAQLLNTVAVMLTAGMTYLTLEPVIGTKRSKTAAFICLLLPGAIFLNSPMTEPLFMLFSVCAFFFMQKKKFLIAGIFTAFAGFTRSLGVLLAIPIAIVGIDNIVGLIREKKRWGAALTTLIIGLVISTFGTLGYLAVNYSVHGDPLKFFEFQWEHWHQKTCFFFDTPRYMLRYLRTSLTDKPENFYSLWLPNLLAIFGSLAIMLPKAKKLPAAYTVFFLCYYAVSVGCTWLLSPVRYLCAALPVTAAIGLSCDKKWKTAVIFTILAALYITYTFFYMARLGIY